MEPIATILTGSRAFFTDMPDFHPHDTDYVVLVHPEDVDFLFKRYRPDRRNRTCYFYVVLQPKERMVRWMAAHAAPMSLCMFLLPEFRDAFGLTIFDLEQLLPLRQALDARHEYLGYIYDRYIETQSFTLTDIERREAFRIYQDARR